MFKGRPVASAPASAPPSRSNPSRNSAPSYAPPVHPSVRTPDRVSTDDIEMPHDSFAFLLDMATPPRQYVVIGNGTRLILSPMNLLSFARFTTALRKISSMSELLVYLPKVGDLFNMYSETLSDEDRRGAWNLVTEALLNTAPTILTDMLLAALETYENAEYAEVGDQSRYDANGVFEGNPHLRAMILSATPLQAASVVKAAVMQSNLGKTMTTFLGALIPGMGDSPVLPETPTEQMEEMEVGVEEERVETREDEQEG